MLKNQSVLEYKVKENLYQFSCNNNAPISEVKDALCHMIKYVGQVEDANIEAQRRAAEEAEKQKSEAEVEETKIEEIKEG